MKHLAISISAITLGLTLAGCSAEKSPAEPAAAASQSAEAPQSAGAPAAKALPSFDCAKAASEIETLVCADPALARLDVEIARLYALAEADPNHAGAERNELKVMQRGWVKGRDDCWKAEDKRECAVSAYAMRALELRQNFSNARSADAAGISSGPVALACAGIDYGIGVVFINSDPDVAYLRWLDQGVALSQVEAASGAKYQGQSADGAYTLWSKGDDATLTRPGTPELKCKLEEIG